MQDATGMTRRSVVVGGTAGIVSLAGCLDTFTGGSGSRSRTFECRISRAGEKLAMTVEPEGDVEGVVEVQVGDEVTFEFTNATDAEVGVHNHVNDGEVTIDAGGTHAMAFEVTDDMVGRHEIEGWITGSAGGHHEETTEDGHHDEETTTETHHHEDEGDHGETVTLLVVEVRPAGG